MVSQIDCESYLYKLSRRLWVSSRADGLGIPISDVFYTRWAIYERTGVLYTPEHVKISMWLEGGLPVGEVDSIPEWYVKSYMGGVVPDMDALKAKVDKLYNLRLAKLKAVDLEEEY